MSDLIAIAYPDLNTAKQVADNVARLQKSHDIELEDLVDPSGPVVPDAAGRTVYRIVQEGMTNARKHAPGALLTIRITGTPDDGIDVQLRNPLGFGPTHTPGAGLGLVGLTERAELRGGLLESGLDGSTFVLHGWIPWGT